ncbi:hypothetical protein EVG20_g3746 [Dentipellis fragilis]|uniref:F-box domain-containing protein n=1 Tax=Dentipellis fragilis TaxID=205917 RepID=A0A4Y9YZY2_9AGAM|nr:hypothetical protein EVG20_g3746 [Dentipellis fragilis]
MGQDWLVLNLNKHQKVEVGKLGEGFFEATLSKRGLGRMPQIKMLPYFKPPPSSPSPLQPKGLDGLPNEMVGIIFEHLGDSDYLELLRLALTARRYWNLARPHIKRAVVSFLKSYLWAGDRLICLGQYTELPDLPPGFIDDCHEGYLEIHGHLLDLDDYTDEDDPENWDMWEFISDCFRRHPYRNSSHCQEPGRTRLGTDLLKGRLRMSLNMYSQQRRWLGLEYYYKLSPDDCVPVETFDNTSLVLRNLSTSLCDTADFLWTWRRRRRNGDMVKLTWSLPRTLEFADLRILALVFGPPSGPLRCGPVLHPAAMDVLGHVSDKDTVEFMP